MSEPADASGAAFWGGADETEALRRYHTLVNTLSDGIFRLDDDGRFAAVNDALVEMVGGTREDLVGERVSAVFEDCSSAIDRELDRLRTNPPDTTRFECTVDPPEGERIRCDVRLDSPADGGTLDETVGVVRDVTHLDHDERTASDTDQEGDRDRTLERRRVMDALEAAEEGISLLDDDGEFIYVNEAYAETFGYDPAEMIGEHWDDLGIEENPDRFYDEVLPNIAAEDQWTGTSTCVRSDGTTFRAQHSLTHTQDEELICVVRDVTETRERERALEESERRYRTLVEHFPNGAVALVDDDLRYQTVGGSPLDVADVTAEEAVGRPVREVIPDDLADDLVACYEDALAGESSAFETEATNGVFEFQTVPIRDEDGEVFAALGMSQDVTQRTERERELRRKERRFEAVFEDPNILVGLLDPDGTVLDINQTAMEYIDADLEAVTGEPFWETPWWGEGDEIRSDVREWTERAAAGEYVDFEADLTRPDGQRYTLEGVFRPVTNDDGEVVSVIVSDRDVTERKEHARQLEESERRYRALAEYFPNGLVTLFDHDLEYTLAAGQGFERVPVDPGDVEGSRFGEVWDDDAADVLRPALEDALDGEERAIEVEYAGRDWVVHAVPITDERGEVFAGMTMAQDITERKERRRRIEESERRYRTLVENFPNGAVGLFDEDLRYTVAGGKMLDDVGTSVEEIVGQTVWERYPEELARQFEPNFRAAIEDGETNEFQIEFHDRHWIAYTVPVRDSDGHVFAGMVMVQDITEQIEREQALQESKNQLQALIELLPVAVFVAEDDGRIVEWNEAAEEIWGGEVVESDSIAEYDRYDGWWADTGEPVEPDEWALARALRGEEVTDPDVIEIEGFDGERRTVLNHGMPVRDADGEVTRAVVTLIDITERNEYQRRLEESNERLEQFAHAASHDLQEPLRMVSSYLRLVEQRYADELDEDGREFIDYAVDGADRMREMIEGLLQYSRVETRGDSFEPVDLDSVLDDVLADLQVTIEESGAEITAAPLPQVTGDEGQLRQLFQNLIENAIEYSGEDRPRVHVEAERVGSEWHVSVTDEGIGIDPADQERVFEVFQSLHAPDDYSATGIGLALCERIVERHGGEIWVDSEPGEGSTFTFTLPVRGDNSE